MKLFRLVMVAALLVTGFAFFPTRSMVSAECVSASGNGNSDWAFGPYTMMAGDSVSVIMTTDEGRGTRILIAAYGALQVDSVQYTASHSASYTLPADATDVVILVDWEYNGQPSNTFNLTAGCAGGRDMAALPSQAVVGAFVANTELLSAPSANAGTGLTMEAVQTLWVYGMDSSGMYYQVQISGSLLWVPVSSMGPNFDDVWNGTPLPTTVVE